MAPKGHKKKRHKWKELYEEIEAMHVDDTLIWRTEVRIAAGALREHFSRNKLIGMYRVIISDATGKLYIVRIR